MSKVDALFGAWLGENYRGIFIGPPTCGTEPIHVVAHIVVAELADLDEGMVSRSN